MMIETIGCRALLKNGFAIFNFCVLSIMEMQLPQDFKEFLRLLNEQQIEHSSSSWAECGA